MSKLASRIPKFWGKLSPEWNRKPANPEGYCSVLQPADLYKNPSVIWNGSLLQLHVKHIYISNPGWRLAFIVHQQVSHLYGLFRILVETTELTVELQTCAHHLPLRLSTGKTAHNASTRLSVSLYNSPLPSILTAPQDTEPGLNVCLTCFNGGCSGSRDHARLHFERFGHPLALNIRRSLKRVQVSSPQAVCSVLYSRLRDKSERSLHRRYQNLRLLQRQTKIVTIQVPIWFAILAVATILTTRAASSRRLLKV